MKNILLSILILLCTYNLKAQFLTYQKPDYVDIKNKVTDLNSKFFIENLLEKYKNFDSTLTNEELKYLYYGYIYSKYYVAFWSPKNRKEINRYLSSDISPNNYKVLLSLSQTAIDDFPFDLEALALIGYINHLQNNNDFSNKVSNIYHKLIQVIMNTGNGLECESGYHVIVVDNEYSIMKINDLHFTSQAFTGNCDVFSLEKSTISQIFFNIQELVKKENEASEKKSSKD